MLSRLFSSVLILLACTALFAQEPTTHTAPVVESTPVTNTTTVVPPPTLSVENLTKFKGNTIEQEEFAPESWNYVAPNEHYNHFFEGCLPKEGGAYISVGTFRGMNVASSGKVSHLVLMDLDASAVLFNKINLQLVAKAKDRFQYLSFLFTGQEQPELEKKAANNELTPTAFMEELSKKKNPDLMAAWKTLGVSLEEKEWERFKKNTGTFSSSSISSFNEMMDKIRSEFSFYDGSSKNWDKTFMGNDVRFSKMKELINENKVTVVIGSVCGDKTLKSLAEVFKKEDTKVAALDFSNVPTTYLSSRGDLTEKSLNNVRGFSFREKGKLLYTANFAPGSIEPAGGGWGYLSMNANHLPGLKTYPTFGLSYEAADQVIHTMKVDPANASDQRRIFYSSEDAPCNEP